MYVTEAMIQSMEEMMRNASDMEKSIKMMMESEGRMHGLELDRRHSARDMWKQLMDHMSSASAQSSMMTEMADPMEHHHEDTGVTHAHPGGDQPHDHAHEDMDGLPSDVEPPIENTMPPGEAPADAPMSVAEQVALERGTATAPDQDENK